MLIARFLLLLVAFVTSSFAVDPSSENSDNPNTAFVQHSSAGGSLRANNPLLIPFALCGALWSSLANAQSSVVSSPTQQRFVNQEDDDIAEGVYANIQLDDDDNDFTGDIADDFETAPAPSIQFWPLTYPQVFAVIIAMFVLGFWASYDMTGGALTGPRLAAIAARARANGGMLSYTIFIASTAAMRFMIWLVQAGFVIIGTIYILQKMYQWPVIENNNGTQTVIAARGMFLVAQAPPNAAGLPATARVVQVLSPNVVDINVPPYMFFNGGARVFIDLAGAAGAANAELVISPTPIHIRNTWYVYIVSVLLIAMVMFNLATALTFRAGCFMTAGFVSFMALVGFVLLIIFTSFELSDMNPGQEWGPPIAMVIYAAFATLISLVLAGFFIGFSLLVRRDEYADILALSDEEALAQSTETQAKRRTQ